MLTRTAAAFLALSLFSSSAFAAASRSFTVGAVVVASATVTSSVRATTQDRVDVQVTKRGANAPMLMVDGRLKPVSESGSAQLPTSGAGDVILTLLY